MKLLLLGIVLFISSTAEAEGGADAPRSTTGITVEASSVHLGIKKPGMFSPGNLYDGVASTSYCGAPGQPAHVSFAAPTHGADEAQLRQITHVKLVGGPTAAVSRTVTIRIEYIPGSGRHQLKTTSTTIEASETITLPLGIPKNAIAIHVHVLIAPAIGGNRNQPLCLGGVAFQSGSEVTSLTELAHAVHLESARYESLAKAKTRQAYTESYLTQHRWVRFNPDKKQSTWETASYQFSQDGTFVRQNRPNRLNPSIRTGTWRVKKSRLVVLTGDDLRRFRLMRCRRHRGYLCVNKAAMRPKQTF